MLHEALRSRAELDRLLEANHATGRQPKAYGRGLESHITAVLEAQRSTNSSEAARRLSRLFGGAGSLVVPAADMDAVPPLRAPTASSSSSSSDGSGESLWQEACRRLEAGAVSVAALSPDGVRIMVDGRATGYSEAERARLAVARAVQLADSAISNEAALSMAECVLVQCLRTVAAAPSLIVEAATKALLGDIQTPPWADRLAVDALSRRRQTVEVRVAARSTRGGLAFGATATARGRVRVNLLPPGARGASAATDPSEIGQFLCTVVVGWPLAGLGGLAEFQEHNTLAAAPPAEVTVTLVWERPERGEDSQDDGDSSLEDWEDAEGASSGDEGGHAYGHGGGPLSGGQQEPLRRRHHFEPTSATQEVLCWGDNEHGELSDAEHSVLMVPAPLSWQGLTPWEAVRQVATSARHTVLCTTLGAAGDVD